jgi:hypothetical protein
VAPREDKPARLVTLRKFRDLPEALVAKSILDSAGIQCFLADENTIRMDWFWSNLLGGVKLWVAGENADAAADLLKQDFSDGYYVDGVGEYRQTRCPNCQSSDTSFEGLNKPVVYLALLLLGVPIPLKRHGWKCHSCGHNWQHGDDAAH